MVENKDIRWIQRYNSFHKALGRILEVTDKKLAQEVLNSQLDD